ncbi:hypothetical protein PS15m_002562 [Mucor circinelloides]
MIQRESTYLKKAFMANSFSYKEFLSEYNYTNANDAISTLNSHFYCLKKLVKPKRISHWAEDRLQEIDRMMKSEEMISCFNDCRRKESMNQMQENSFLEEGVYLRTRKSTLEELLNQTEASSSNSTQAAATTISSISSSDQAAATLMLLPTYIMISHFYPTLLMILILSTTRVSPRTFTTNHIF